VLFIETMLERFFALRFQWQEIEIVIRSPMKYVAVEIDSGINECVGDAAIFGLNVIGDFAHFHVGIVPKSIGSFIFSRTLIRIRAQELPAGFDRAAGESYYSKSPMSGSGLHTYAPLLLHLLIAAALAGALTAVSVLVGWRRPSRAKQQAYECGMEPTGDAREPFSVSSISWRWFLFCST